jgi:cytochrome P450
MAAGSDTTAATIEAAILYMILHPEAAKKAQAELDAVIGKNRLPVLGDRPDLPYVTAFLMVQCLDTVYYRANSVVLQEVMRCFPVVAFGGCLEGGRRFDC